MKRVQKKAFQYIKENEYNLCIFVKGNFLTPDFLSKIREARCNLKIACWLMDPIGTLAEYVPSYSLCDHLFFYDQRDLAFAQKKFNIQYSVLPLCYDPTFYSPSINIRKEYQLSFIGVLRGYRLSILEFLMENTNIKGSDFYLCDGSLKRTLFFLSFLKVGNPYSIRIQLFGKND